MAIDIKKYQVDFTDSDVLDGRDQVKYAQDWMLDQFRKEPSAESNWTYPVVIQLIQQMASIINNNLWHSPFAVAKARTIAESEGVWLEGIGRIVGQEKELIPADKPSVFFTWDSDTLMMDNSLQWVTGVPDSGDYDIPTDNDYRAQIVRRIFQNMNRYSSIPEIKSAVLAVLGIDIKIEQLGARYIKLWVPTGTPTWMKYILTGKSFNVATGGYNRWYFPFPAGIKIDSTIGEY